jgi:hypothetical protein
MPEVVSFRIWHATSYVSSSYYVSAYYCICVLILLYMCPRTTMYVSSYYYTCVLNTDLPCIYIHIHIHRGASRAQAARSHFSRQLAGVSSSPNPSIHVSSYYYICVSSYSYICVLILPGLACTASWQVSVMTHS